ncbi:MAG: hypothetical protein HFI49_01690 [Bacilli bacterium]|jgi:hypothetical protein|nr:hypothetical protein [Bacilli bacterium]
MGLKINHIIVLENKEEYIILNETMYNGKKYFLSMGLNKKREVVTNKVVILEEYISGFDTYVSKVVDSELIAILTRMFKAQAKLS